MAGEGLSAAGLSAGMGGASGGASASAGMAGGMGGLGAGMATKAMGMFSDIAASFGRMAEFQRQQQVEINILENNTQMVLIAEKQVKRDIDIRAGIMSGDFIAGAGARGVSADSASIVNGAAAIIARSKVDKLRVQIQAQNQVNLNKYKQEELRRQNKMAQSKAIQDSLTSVSKAFAM